MGNWKSVDKEDDEEEERVKFDDEDVKEWLDKGSKTKVSTICTGIYGSDGSGKSGVCMDSRTEEEKEEGKKVVVIDLDNSSAPLKTKYFEDDENIIVYNPIEHDEDGEPDDPVTYEKTKALTKYLVENQDELNLSSVVFDGVDKFKRTCDQKMREEDLDIDPNARVKNSWSWGIRNRYYKTVMEMIKNLNCDRFYITHMKDKKEFINNELQTVGKEIDWHHSTPGMLFQRIKTERREEEDGIVKFIAKVEKAKGALHLEGQEFTIAEVNDDETEWYGLQDLWNELKGVEE